MTPSSRCAEPRELGDGDTEEQPPGGPALARVTMRRWRAARGLEQARARWGRDTPPGSSPAPCARPGGGDLSSHPVDSREEKREEKEAQGRSSTFGRMEPNVRFWITERQVRPRTRAAGGGARRGAWSRRLARVTLGRPRGLITRLPTPGPGRGRKGNPGLLEASIYGSSPNATFAPGLAGKGRHKVTLQVALKEESVSFRRCLLSAA